MRLKVDELKKFLSASSQIKPNPTATNLDSIKIECTGQDIILTKTNNNIWCKYNYITQPQALECFLVNEKMLNGIVVTTKEFEIEINITPDGSKLHIVSGEDILKVATQDLNFFPPIQEATGDRVRISKTCVERIRIASKYISTAPNRTAMNFVQIGLNGIFATNGSIMYYHNTFPLPEVFFDEEPLNTIKATDDMLYWTSASYDFFAIDGFTFGFIKSIIKGLDYMPIIDCKGTTFFTCKRQDLIDFCTLVQYSKKQEHPLATFQSINDKELFLKFYDPDFNIDASRNIIIESNGIIAEFKFSIDWVNIMLKTLPYETLTFTSFENGHYAVTSVDDPDYKGIIAKLK
jgi:hypothetical protein